MKHTIAGIVLATLTIVACGGSSDDRVIVSPGDAVQGVRATSARILETEDNGEGPQWVSETSGVFDFGRRAGLLESRLSRDDDDQPMPMRIVDNVAYFRIDGELESWNDGAEPLYTPGDPCFRKAWGAIDPKSIPPDPGRGRNDSPNGFLPTSDVSGAIAALEEKGGTLQPLGAVTVRGVGAREYRVDVSSLDVGAPFNDPYWGVRLTAMRVAVDDQQRLVRLVYTTRSDSSQSQISKELAKQLAPGSPQMTEPFISETTTTLELWDFGVPVAVEKPPADQTCDFLAQFGKTMDEFD